MSPDRLANERDWRHFGRLLIVDQRSPWPVAAKDVFRAAATRARPLVLFASDDSDDTTNLDVRCFILSWRLTSVPMS